MRRSLNCAHGGSPCAKNAKHSGLSTRTIRRRPSDKQGSWSCVGADLSCVRPACDRHGRAICAPSRCRDPGGHKTGPPLVWGLSRGEKWTSELLLLSSLLPFWRVSSFAETFLHLDATFFLTLPRRRNLLVDSVLRRGQFLVEADRDIR